jgi:hypothetical protein
MMVRYATYIINIFLNSPLPRVNDHHTSRLVSSIVISATGEYLTGLVGSMFLPVEYCPTFRHRKPRSSMVKAAIPTGPPCLLL